MMQSSKLISQEVDVLVLGGGIIGSSVAHELQSSGRQVVLMDKGQPGFGCSYGNAGWMTPCFSMPLPQPGMFWKSVGWLFNPESPLRIKPELSWNLLRWLLAFLTAMTTKKMKKSVEVLTEISKFSLEFYAALAKRNTNSFGFDQKGLLMVSATDEGLAAAKLEMNLMAERGIEGRFLTREEVLALEPALKPLIKGGVYFPTEAHGEPLAIVQAIVKEFEAMGGQLSPNTEAFDFTFENGKIKYVHTTHGVFAPKEVVLALGNWSPGFAKRLGVRVPILGGKGYSMIIEDFEKKPKLPIMILERKIAVTPRADSVRIAGTLELVNQDFEITPRRLNAIRRGAAEYLHLAEDPVVREIWRGLRPCTPDGVPMIGRSKKWGNLVYCTGHQMLGLQSAPGSAKVCADLMLGRTTFVDTKPFDPARYE
jgi:D-amino-acid dehydrogenase